MIGLFALGVLFGAITAIVTFILAIRSYARFIGPRAIDTMEKMADRVVFGSLKGEVLEPQRNVMELFADIPNEESTKNI